MIQNVPLFDLKNTSGGLIAPGGEVTHREDESARGLVVGVVGANAAVLWSRDPVLPPKRSAFEEERANVAKFMSMELNRHVRESDIVSINKTMSMDGDQEVEVDMLEDSDDFSYRSHSGMIPSRHTTRRYVLRLGKNVQSQWPDMLSYIGVGRR